MKNLIHPMSQQRLTTPSKINDRVPSIPMFSATHMCSISR